MELEAVSLVGIDRLAERIPLSVPPISNVGVTRAGQSIRVPDLRNDPAQAALKPVRSHFTTASWMEA